MCICIYCYTCIYPSNEMIQEISYWSIKWLQFRLSAKVGTQVRRVSWSDTWKGWVRMDWQKDSSWAYSMFVPSRDWPCWTKLGWVETGADEQAGPTAKLAGPAEGRRTRLQLENQFLGHFCPENRSWKEKFILQNRLFTSFLFLLRSVVWARRKRGEARLLWLDYFVSCCSVDVFFTSLCAGPRMEGAPREPLAWVRNRPCRC